MLLKQGGVLTITSDRHISRRAFLTSSAAGALAFGAFVSVTMEGRAAGDKPAEDAPNTHNMLVFGEQTIFLSHLPMFGGPDETNTGFVSPHRYQVILEVAFTKQGKDLRDIYVKDRRAHPKTRIYTLNPSRFVLSRLFTPSTAPRLTSFSGTVFRGHLEQGGTPVPGLEKINVKVLRVVHGRKFDPIANGPGELEYLLVGKGAEGFLAHAVFTPPNFDQVLPVTITGHELSDTDLRQDLRIVVPGRKNTAADRLREGQKAQAILRFGPAPGKTPSPVQIVVGSQVYFEEGELLVPPNFDLTSEEKKG